MAFRDIRYIAEDSGLSAPTIWRKVREETFPAPVVLSTNKHGRPTRVAWDDGPDSEYARWKASRVKREARQLKTGVAA